MVVDTGPNRTQVGGSSHTGPVALRGHIVSCLADPFFSSDQEPLLDIPDGVVIIHDGLIAAVGSYATTTVDASIPVMDYGDCLISAGFIDSHVHYVQTPILGSYGRHLLDWLNTYTFPDEQRFADSDYAASVATFFFDQLLRNGTTSALVFCAVFAESVDAFFTEASRRNMRMVGGKVLMNRNAPPGVLDTVQSGYDDSKALLEKWHGVGRGLYAITPRFAPTSTEGQLEAAGQLRREFPSALVHTHVSENIAEIAWVRALFPERDGYLDVYDHAGLLGPKTVLAHGVHLTGSERERCSETGTAIAHCPTSNLFLGSGLFHIHQAKNARHPIAVGLGTDIGAGTSFSLLATMGEAYKVAELTSYPLDAVKLLFLATLGGAEALGIADKVGSIEVGKEADLVVLDTRASELQAYRRDQVSSVEEQLFLLSVLGDDRSIRATYIAGEIAHAREDSNAVGRPGSAALIRPPVPV